MKFGTLEILATILIAFSVIKLIVILISPQSWLRFLRNIYIRPAITSTIAFILAAIVLYFLIAAGVSIVHILAVTLFIALIIVIGMARYADQLINWVVGQDLKIILREQWFYTLVWLALLAWGIQAIFFS
jgi:hypothetical protein